MYKIIVTFIKFLLHQEAWVVNKNHQQAAALNVSQWLEQHCCLT